MWEISNSFQVFGFVGAVVTGGVLGTVYDFLRAFRKVYHPSIFHIALSDIIFSFFAAIFCFYMELAFTAGKVRWYFLMGILFGFWIERITVSRIFVPGLTFLLRGITTSISTFSAFLQHGLEYFEAKMAKILRKSAYILKKVGKTLKKLLKKG